MSGAPPGTEADPEMGGTGEQWATGMQGDGGMAGRMNPGKEVAGGKKGWGRQGGRQGGISHGPD